MGNNNNNKKTSTKQNDNNKSTENKETDMSTNDQDSVVTQKTEIDYSKIQEQIFNKLLSEFAAKVADQIKDSLNKENTSTEEEEEEEVKPTQKTPQVNTKKTESTGTRGRQALIPEVKFKNALKRAKSIQDVINAFPVLKDLPYDKARQYVISRASYIRKNSKDAGELKYFPRGRPSSN